MTLSGGAVIAVNVINGGSGYTGTPTATIMPPFAANFSTTTSLGGTVALTSGSLTEGNL